MTRSLRPLLLTLLAAAVWAAASPTASLASTDLATGIADDAALLKERDPLKQEELVAAWQDMGIDTVRLLAEWHVVSPGRAEVTIPEGFDPADPDSPGYDWGALDRAIDVVTRRGMRVFVTITGPAPLWATTVPARRDIRYKPRPDLFGRFAYAVARRYGSKVDRYILWNEPSIPLWLKPQFTCVGRRCTPYSPHLYRRLVRAAYPAIKAADPGAMVLFGALPSRGHNPLSANATMRPLTFLRALGCVDDLFKKTRKGLCAGFKPLTADAFSYHPHGQLRAPDEPNPNLDEAQVGDLGRLEKTLDTVQARGGFKNGRGGRFELHFTEFGYQTNPPDPFAGVSPVKQSRWLQQSAYVFWHNPRVKTVIQYEWRDEPLGRGRSPVSRYSGWQSGLRTAADRAKQSYFSFPNPVHVHLRPGSRAATVWGQVRPGEAHEVTVQRRRAGAATWITIRRLQTNARGYFSLKQTVTAKTDFRFSWQPKDEYDQSVAPVRYSEWVRARPKAKPKLAR